MLIENVIQALKERCPSFGESIAARRFAGAAEYAQLSEAAKLNFPSAYVVPLDDETEQQESSNGYRQIVSDVFAVIVVLSNTTDERGQTSIMQVQAIRKELWAALLGWKPDTEHDRIEYDGGQLMSVDRARLYYQFEFKSAFQINESDTWQAVANAALPAFNTMHIDVDAIDPADANIATPGPDGVIEVSLDVAIPQ